MSKIFGANGPSDGRRRVVRETGKSSSTQPLTTPTDTPSPVEETYTKFSDLINAANAVLPYMGDAARNVSIDVPSNMSELRAAVSRKDNLNPIGDKISFDLFTKTLKHFETLRNEFSKNVLADLTGHAGKDAVIIGNKAAIATSSLSVPWSDLWNSAWFSRYTLWILLKQFAVGTIVHQTSAKLPAGTEAAGYAADFIHSVGMGFVIDAANAEFAELASEGNAIVADFIASTRGGGEAGSQVELSDLEQLAVDKVAEGDYVKIMDYCMKEISSVSDSSLVTWLSYANARGIRNDAVGTFRYQPQYTQPAPDGSGPKVNIAPSHLSALNQRVSAMNGSLMLNVQVAGLSFEADLLCCLTRMFGNQSTESLKAARQVLRLAQKLRVNEFAITVDQVSKDYTNFLTKATTNNLLALLDRTMDKAVIKALDTTRYDDEDFMAITDYCPAFLDYSEILFDAAEYLAELIFGVTTDLADQPIAAAPAKNPYARSTGHIVHKKWIDTALSLIDEVINVIDNGNCDLDEHGRMPAERTQELVSNVYNSTSQGVVRIPDEVIETHFPDMAEVSIPAPGGRYSFTVPKNGTAASSVDERAAMRQVFERCGKQLSDDDLDRILKDTNGVI